MSTDLESVRARLSTFLVDSVTAVVEDYRRFTTQTPPEDSKGFAAWHAAAKAALAHAELAIKLARWCETGGKAEDPAEDSLGRLMEAARAAVGADDQDEGDEDQ